jgi:dCMP deaminase
MQHAHVAARRSTCARAQVGAVVSRDGRVLVTGYNGAPAGMPHCDHTCDCTAKFWHKHEDWCRSIAPCTESVHAEENCIAYAAKWGIPLDGGVMHTTDSPCLLCSRLIVNAGITEVRYDRMYRVTEGLKLLEAAGVKHEQVAWMDPK